MKERSTAATKKYDGPDRTQPDQYPEPAQISLTHWRWQFLRRDREYRKEWEAYRARGGPFNIALEGNPSDPDLFFPYYPDEHEDLWDDIWRVLRKYGLTRLHDPSVSSPAELRFHFVPFAPDATDNPQLRGVEVRSIPWQLQYPYLGWFDLWKPIEPQIRHYRALLQREQDFALQLLTDRAEHASSKGSKKGGKKRKSIIEAEMEEALAIAQGTWDPSQFKVRSSAKRDRIPIIEQWPKFLRVIDAREQGASWGVIGKEILCVRDNVQANAKATYNAATTLWWKIRIERDQSQIVGIEEGLRMEDSFSIFPPLPAGKPLLQTWFDLLHPRLSRIMLSSLM
jgi:hypothetical protein